MTSPRQAVANSVCRRARTSISALAAALLACLSVVGAAGAQNAQSVLSSRLAHELAVAGSGSGAYVYDVSTGTPLFAERASVPHPPASVEKLYTATTALELMGAQGTLATTVLGTGHLGPNGRWEGNLYLHGGGDPTFGSPLFVNLHYGGVGATVTRLALELKRAGIRGVSGSIDGDESFFDSLRGDPSSGFAIDPELEGSLSALAFDRGATGQFTGAHAQAEYAAYELRGAMRAQAIAVHGGTAASAPSDAKQVALVRSPTLSQLLALTLPPSDNYFAETLLKDIGSRYGHAGTTAAGAAVVRKTMLRFHIHPYLIDGSGLSHSDHTTPIEVVTLLATLAHSPLGTTLRKDLAVAGRSGTLSERMRGTAASGRCQAKTGTLNGVSNLAGYCHSASGDILAFAFFNDRIELGKAHTLQDSMAVSLARY
ncbi:MAG TPA: D-alanyl-D-alanine carboxypeptidase/D-alanyl-D-alanine-endopeptidase [Solirubrobacteraceae bacterium]|nr:D-alanyl-D-alanine carboxypeptidase/D-alanyl-D-alanine-endopeptidase [Solirubrobacteraceae bacterium]